MKKKLTRYIFFIFIFCSLWSQAQNPGSGYLIKVHEASATHLDTITGAEKGHLIFNTSNNLLYTYTGSTWLPLGADSDSTNEIIDSATINGDSLSLHINDTVVKVELVKRGPQVLSVSGGNIVWDLAMGSNASITLSTASSAIVMSNVRPGCYGTLVVTQDGTGGRLITFPAGSKIMHGNDKPLTLTPNAVDILSFYYDGTTYYWTYGNNFD